MLVLGAPLEARNLLDVPDAAGHDLDAWVRREQQETLRVREEAVP
jgi:hypothetical protein